MVGGLMDVVVKHVLANVEGTLANNVSPENAERILAWTSGTRR